MEVVLAITLSVVFTVSLIGLIKWYYRSQSMKTKHKITDAEIFKLMARANHFLNDQQLAAVSDLTKQEAKDRLMHLSLEGILRRFQDGGVKSVYQLKEELPEDKVLPIRIDGLSDRQIVDAVLRYSGDYQITIPELVVIFGIDVDEAKAILKRLKKSGLIGTLWRGASIIYVIKDPLTKATPKLEIPMFKQPSPKLKLSQEPVERIKVPDADVLNATIANAGKMTATVLCLKLKIPLSAAKMKLEELYEQGAFIMDVDEKKAVIEYQLRDKSLLP